MKIGDKVYTYNSKRGVFTGVIVSKSLRWNPLPFNEYVVRETKDLSTAGLAGALAAAFGGNPDSLTVQTKDTLFPVVKPPMMTISTDIEESL